MKYEGVSVKKVLQELSRIEKCLKLQSTTQEAACKEYLEAEQIKTNFYNKVEDGTIRKLTEKVISVEKVEKVTHSFFGLWKKVHYEYQYEIGEIQSPYKGVSFTIEPVEKDTPSPDYWTECRYFNMNGKGFRVYTVFPEVKEPAEYEQYQQTQDALHSLLEFKNKVSSVDSIEGKVTLGDADLQTLSYLQKAIQEK